MPLYNNFKIAVFPLDIALGDCDANLQSVAAAMMSMPNDVDILVVPELFSTGFIDTPEMARQLAQPSDGPTMTEIRRLAAKYHCAIAGSFLACDDEKIYNRAFLCEPQGDITFYDKRHLFCLSEESKIATRGYKPIPIVRYRSWNIALCICYDVRFPVWLRNCSNKYDLLIAPANWPDNRAFAWTHLLQARAIENQAYVVGANRTGTDRYGTYSMHAPNQQHHGLPHDIKGTLLSPVYDFMGREIGRCHDSLVIATINKAELETMRTAFPVWRDADSFTIDDI